MPASRPPDTRGVRSMPSADTSVGELTPPRGGVDTADREDDVVLDQRGQRRRGRRVGNQRGQRGCGQRRRLEQWLGQARVACLLQDAHEVDVAQAEPVGGLRHDQGGRTELGKNAPAVARLFSAAVRVRQLERAQSVGSALRVEDDAHALAQFELLVGKGEVHAPGSAGQPEQALGHHVALDLVRPRVNGTGQAEEIAVEPLARRARVQELGVGPE